MSDEHDNANCALVIPRRRNGRFGCGGFDVGAVVVVVADFGDAWNHRVVRFPQSSRHAGAATAGHRRNGTDAKSPFEALTEARRLTGLSDWAWTTAAG